MTNDLQNSGVFGENVTMDDVLEWQMEKLKPHLYFYYGNKGIMFDNQAFDVNLGEMINRKVQATYSFQSHSEK